MSDVTYEEPLATSENGRTTAVAPTRHQPVRFDVTELARTGSKFRYFTEERSYERVLTDADLLEEQQAIDAIVSVISVPLRETARGGLFRRMSRR